MKWFISFVVGILSVVSMLFLISQKLDPYGLKNTQNKRVENLNSEESFLYPLKIQSNSYYLLGTSRTLAFDIKKMEDFLKKKTYFLGISGSNINQWLFLIEKIKEKKSNIILGLDLFSLNQTQIQNNSKPQTLLKESFDNFNWFAKYMYFLNSNFIQTSFSTVFKNCFTPKNHLFVTQNTNNTQEVFQTITKPYENFKLANKQLQHLLSFLSPEDIVIIFPEYWKYYLFYSQQQTYTHQTLLDEYIQIIKTLTLKTQAQIWIFGGINSVTLEDKNFDYNYWHFKPKVADLIIEKIFKQIANPKDFGFQIERQKIDEQLKKWKEVIVSHSL